MTSQLSSLRTAKTVHGRQGHGGLIAVCLLRWLISFGQLFMEMLRRRSKNSSTTSAMRPQTETVPAVLPRKLLAAATVAQVTSCVVMSGATVG